MTGCPFSMPLLAFDEGGVLVAEEATARQGEVRLPPLSAPRDQAGQASQHCTAVPHG